MDSTLFNEYLSLSFYNQETHKEINEFIQKDYLDKKLIPITSLKLTNNLKEIFNKDKVSIGDTFMIDNEMYIINNKEGTSFSNNNNILFDLYIFKIEKNMKTDVLKISENPLSIINSFLNSEINYLCNIYYDDTKILNQYFSWESLSKLYKSLYNTYKNLFFYIKDNNNSVIKVSIYLFNYAYLKKDIAKLFFDKVISNQFSFALVYKVGNDKLLELTIGHSIISLYNKNELVDSFIIKPNKSGELFGLSLKKENQRKIYLHELCHIINKYQSYETKDVEIIDYYVDGKEQSDIFVQKLFEFIS